MSVTPDPKPRRRIRNGDAVKAKLASDPVCRVCSKRASEGHHVLLRSQGGDDVEDNIVPLCTRCHRSYHDGKVELRVRPDELRYLVDRLGYEAALSYLERRRVSYR